MIRIIKWTAFLISLYVVAGDQDKEKKYAAYQTLYCGSRDCYDILEVNQKSTVNEIKKAYRQLSLKFHPDKDPDPQAPKLFQEIATAYEILSAPDKREAYDYYIEHPERVAYNYGMYYRHVYAPKSDFRLVILGFILVVTAIQYMSQWHRYRTAVNHFRNSDKVKRKAILIQSERKRAMASNDKSVTQRVKDRKKEKQNAKKELEEIINELMKTLEISGGYGKPTFANLFIIQLVLLPFTLCKYLYWQLNWIYRFRVLKQEYGEAEVLYLTCRALDVPVDRFESDEQFDGNREDLLTRKLWIQKNLQDYRKEMEDIFRLKHPEKYKRMMRNKKQYRPDLGAPGDGEDDY